MATSLTTEIIRDGRLDIHANPRERFRWEFEVQNDDETPLDLTGTEVQLFLKPLDLSLEPSVTLDATLSSSSTGPVAVSTIPSIFPDKGFVKINDEVLRYDERTTNQLSSLVRAVDETNAAVHAAASSIVLAGRILDINGPTGEKLIIATPTSGSIVWYISQPTLDRFTWTKAEYRLQMVDSLGDPEVLVAGYFIIEKRWAQ